MKIAMIGGKTSTSGFKALGIETFPVEGISRAREVWRRIDPERYGIIFVTEPLAEILGPEIESMAARKFPVVSIVPSVSGSRGAIEGEIRELVERAVGTDMVFRS